jgi:hypothetical protein
MMEQAEYGFVLPLLWEAFAHWDVRSVETEMGSSDYPNAHASMNDGTSQVRLCSPTAVGGVCSFSSLGYQIAETEMGSSDYPKNALASIDISADFGVGFGRQFL